MSDFSKAFGSLGSLMGSTAAGAVGNIASGAANALFGGIQARRNWKYKKKEMALQQKYNLENMQKQFDYQQEAIRPELIKRFLGYIALQINVRGKAYN